MLELPISKSRFKLLSSNPERSSIDRLTSSELASLLFVLKSNDLGTGPNLDRVTTAAEKKLSQLIEITKSDPDTVRQVVCSLLKDIEPSSVIEHLNRHNIYFMSDDRVSEQDYLTMDGSWDFSCRKSDKDYLTTIVTAKKERTVTLDQQRVISTFVAEPDELLHVQAVAGSGKTTLITLAAHHFDPKNVLICAQTWQQIEAIANKLPKDVTKLTYGQLADLVIQKSPNLHVPRFFDRKEQTFSVSYKRMVNILGLSRIGKLSPSRVAEVATKTVTRFCYSPDSTLHSKHIPRQYGHYLSDAEKSIIASISNTLWKQIISPDDNVDVPMRTYHRIKLWALSGEGIPPQFKHVFIDETHDLPIPIIQVVDKSQQGVVTLGDHYQSMGLFDNMVGRHDRVRRRDMSLSYRVGKNSSSLFNHVLQHHPDKPSFEFEGRYDKTTAIIPYTFGSFNKGQTNALTVLSNSVWHLLKTMLLLQNKNAPYKLISSTSKELQWLVSDAIKLYENKPGYSHREFYKHDTFDSYLNDQSEDIRNIIERTICNGFQLEHLQDALSNQSKDNKPCYVLGRVQDSKNTEFSRVMLLNDLLKIEKDTPFDRGVALNRIYLGSTRAINEIYIPENMEDWITDAFRASPE